MMTKANYQLVADAINATRDTMLADAAECAPSAADEALIEATIEQTITELRERFAQDSPRFNADVFDIACNTAEQREVRTRIMATLGIGRPRPTTGE